MAKFFSYSAFGIKIRSEIELPLVVDEFELAVPHLEITQSKFPASLKDSHTKALYQALNSDEILCHIPGVAWYRIHPTKYIQIDAEPGASAESIQLFLLGSAMGVVLQHLDAVILHGSAVKFEDSAVIFAGPSGAGKSTLAMAFANEGFQILTDDIVVIRFDSGGRPQLWPSYPQMKLWKQSLEMLSIENCHLKSIHNRLDKFNFSLRDSFYSSPLPVKQIFILNAKNDESIFQLIPISGMQAYQAIHNNTYRIEYLSQIGNLRAHFRWSVNLLNEVDVTQIDRSAAGCDLKFLVQACKQILSSERRPHESKSLHANYFAQAKA